MTNAKNLSEEELLELKTQTIKALEEMNIEKLKSIFSVPHSNFHINTELRNGESALFIVTRATYSVVAHNANDILANYRTRHRALIQTLLALGADPKQIVGKTSTHRFDSSPLMNVWEKMDDSVVFRDMCEAAQLNKEETTQFFIYTVRFSPMSNIEVKNNVLDYLLAKGVSFQFVLKRPQDRYNIFESCLTKLDLNNFEKVLSFTQNIEDKNIALTALNEFSSILTLAHNVETINAVKEKLELSLHLNEIIETSNTHVNISDMRPKPLFKV